MKEMKKNKRHNAEILISYLLDGHTIKKDGIKYVLSDDFCLCEEGISENTLSKEKKIVLLKINFGEFSLKSFINWANSFTDEEILKFEMVLNKIGGRR